MIVELEERSEVRFLCFVFGWQYETPSLGEVERDGGLSTPVIYISSVYINVVSSFARLIVL